MYSPSLSGSTLCYNMQCYLSDHLNVLFFLHNLVLDVTAQGIAINLDLRQYEDRRVVLTSLYLSIFVYQKLSMRFPSWPWMEGQ